MKKLLTLLLTFSILFCCIMPTSADNPTTSSYVSEKINETDQVLSVDEEVTATLKEILVSQLKESSRIFGQKSLWEK